MTILGSMTDSPECGSSSQPTIFMKLVVGKVISENVPRSLRLCAKLTRPTRNGSFIAEAELQPQFSTLSYIRIIDSNSIFDFTPVYHPEHKLDESNLCVRSSAGARDLGQALSNAGSLEFKNRIASAKVADLNPEHLTEAVSVLSALQLESYLRDDHSQMNRDRAEAALCLEVTDRLKRNFPYLVQETLAIVAAGPTESTESAKTRSDREQSFMKALDINNTDVRNLYVPDSLNRENPEKLAISEYSANGFRLLNPFLRGKLTFECQVCLPFVTELKVALSKLNDARELVFRGIRYPSSEEKIVLNAELQAGNTIPFDAFTSASSDIAVANKFSEDGYLLQILPLHGKSLGQESRFKRELEVLFTAHTQFRVLDRTDDIVILKELP